MGLSIPKSSKGESSLSQGDARTGQGTTLSPPWGMLDAFPITAGLLPLPETP